MRYIIVLNEKEVCTNSEGNCFDSMAKVLKHLEEEIDGNNEVRIYEVSAEYSAICKVPKRMNWTHKRVKL